MVDPYIAMQSRTVAGPVPVPLQSTTTPTPTPRPPNSMARPVANGAPAPAGSAVPPAPQGTPGQGPPAPGPPGPPGQPSAPGMGAYEQDPLLDDVESGETVLQEERTDHEEEDHSSGLDVSALPGHMDHYCTNWIWIFILPLALSALYFPMEKAIHEGDVTKFFRGFDYYGRMCGRDLCDGVKCGPFTYYCGKTLDEMPDTAHPICVDSCPTGNSTSHICWDEDSLSTVSLPDLPTEEFNMKCLQLAHVQKEHEKKNAKLFKGLEDFKGAGSLVGLLMDSLHSVKRAWTILILTFFVALATGTFYMVFLKFLAAFLIYVSLSLMTIIPFVFGAFHIIKVFTSGGFGEVLGGNTEVQTSFLSGIGGICVAFVLCCTLTKISQGVATATGCIVATTDCMFSIPSILFEPLVSITLKASIAGPMVYLGVMLVSTGQMVLLMGNDKMHRTVSLQGEQWVYLAYVVFMCLWLVEITHNGTQYVLAYVTERWYFIPFVEDVKVDIPHPCIVLEAIFNMFRYHLGSVILSAFLKTLFRVPKIISFTLYLVGCCDHRRKGRDPEEKLNKCSCRLLMKLLRKEGYMGLPLDVLRRMVIEVVNHTSYTQLWTSKGMLCQKHVSIWAPEQNVASFFRVSLKVSLGHYANRGFSDARGGDSMGVGKRSILQVRDRQTFGRSSDEYLQMVADHYCPAPVRWRQVWSQNRGTPLFLWRPVPPSEGFVALGMVATVSPEPPPLSAARCVCKSFCRPSAEAPMQLWDDSGSGGKPASIWLVNAPQVLWASVGHNPPHETFWELANESITFDYLGRPSLHVVHEVSSPIPRRDSSTAEVLETSSWSLTNLFSSNRRRSY